MNLDMAMTYLDFVEERHRVWQRRQNGPSFLYSDELGWSSNKILTSHKFTNVFRILDVGSQFVVKELLYSDDVSFQDKLTRVFLYRYTNRPEPWIAFKQVHGRYPDYSDLRSGKLIQYWMLYQQELKLPIFSPAYKMFCGADGKGIGRLRWAHDLTFNSITEDFAYVFLNLGSQSDRHALLKTIRRCADFMAMQVLTDIGLSAEMRADENAFVVPGPGCIRGAAHINPNATAREMIEWCHSTVLEQDRCPTIWTGTGYRVPSLMDIQNTLCEFSKYVRYLRKEPGRERSYQPKHLGTQEPPFVPPHWKEPAA